MVVYKAFKEGMVCRGYQFHMGINITDKANCAQNGFHAAENPIDCFRHYHPYPGCQDEYYMCEASGDIDEDDRDSKISCTCLNIVRKLTLYDMAACALLYMKKYPEREFKEYDSPVVAVKENKAAVQVPGIAIARGKIPMAAGPVGCSLGFAVTDGNDVVKRVQIAMVDGIHVFPGRYYTLKEGGLREA